MKKLVLLFSFFCTATLVSSQSTLPPQQAPVNRAKLDKLIEQLQQRHEGYAQQRADYVRKNPGFNILEIGEDDKITALIKFLPNGHPVFYETHNTDAAVTTGTDLLHPGGGAGLNLTGLGFNIGEWDGGGVRTTHVELTGRVTQIDNPSSLSDHATHVAGTMIATGIDTDAKGMAYQANISAYDFFSDEFEMAQYASSNPLLSNHSYGRITGWRFVSSSSVWRWYGDTTLSVSEDYAFGYYDFQASIWDTIAEAAPYYLMVKSAGNDRNDSPPSSVTSHEVWDNNTGNWIISTAQRPQDCPTGYDCIAGSGTSKNVLTVGAVQDIAGGYSQPSDVVMSSFSGWGPTDDGRIKPDIVGNGVSLYSTGSSNNTDYYNSSGTSMSAPNVTGSLALLQQHYQNLNSQFMPSSALKALILHTANEAGTATGPDYEYGWGLLNADGAADLISDTVTNILTWDTLADGDSLQWVVYSNGTGPLEATICWTDPAGTPVTPALDPTASMLVNDLDLRIIENSSGTMNMPFVLNPAMPSMAATMGDNVRDNVEKVYMASPTAGFYVIRIKHKGSLTGGSQAVSLVVSGVAPGPASTPPVADFIAADTTLCAGDSVQFTDLSTNIPTTWSWTFQGGTPATASVPNPMVHYTTPGTYMVKLVVSNLFGADSLTRMSYIEVDSIPVVDFTFLNDVCMDAGPIGLNNYVSVTGGVFSGPGVTGNLFDPIAAGMGQHMLYYTYTSAGGCVAQDSSLTEVVAVPNASHPSLPPVCMSSLDFVLSGGTPTGGVYSGTGVLNDSIFSPSTAGMGTHTLVYTVTNSAGCTDTAQFTVTVVPGVGVVFNSPPDACVSGGVVPLSGGTPAGGVYTGVGVDTLAGTFDPSVTGVGVFILTYTANTGPCVASDTAFITVLPDPSVQLTIPTASKVACVGQLPYPLSGGSPAGGTFSGPGVMMGQFNPAMAGLGIHGITYTYTDGAGCSASTTDSIVVNSTISVTMGDTFGICESAAPFVLTLGNPFGGAYSGPGMLDTVQFSPAQAGPGQHMITYQYSVNGCTGLDSGIVEVVPVQVVTFDTLPDVCASLPAFMLTGGQPTGGTYSGSGVTNGMFDPAVAGAGTHVLTYTWTDSIAGCSNSATQTITVISPQAQLMGLDSIYCSSDSAVTIMGLPMGGTFSGPGLSGTTFDPGMAGIGAHTITYTVTSGGCSDTATQQTQVIGADSIAGIVGPTTASQNGAYTYFVPAVNGAVYTWMVSGGTVVAQNNNAIQVQWGVGIAGMVSVTQTPDRGCPNDTLLTVNLWPLSNGEELSVENIRAFPNPANDRLTLANVPLGQAGNVYLFDATGRQVVARTIQNSGETIQVDVSQLPAGNYIVWLQLRDVQWSSNVIVE